MSEKGRPPEITTPFLRKGYTDWLLAKTCEQFGFAVTPEGAVWVSDLVATHMKTGGWETTYSKGEIRQVSAQGANLLRNFLEALQWVGRSPWQ